MITKSRVLERWRIERIKRWSHKERRKERGESKKKKKIEVPCKEEESFSIFGHHQDLVHLQANRKRLDSKKHGTILGASVQKYNSLRDCLATTPKTQTV